MKILVVDDHGLICDGLGLLLPALDPQFSTLAARSCEAALALPDAQKADVQLILLDLGLPGASGTDGIAAMRAGFPEVPVVVMSGTEDADTIIGAIRGGAMGFIPKSYSGDRLLGALRFVLVHRGVFLPAESLVSGGASALGGAGGAGGSGGYAIEDSAEAGAVSPQSLGLTPRQAAVLHLVLQGKSNKAIARELCIEDSTVRSHVTVVLRCLNATTRTQAVVAAHRLRLGFGEAADRRGGGPPDRVAGQA